MRCEFRGHPVPEIRWLKNEAPIEPQKGKFQMKQQILPNGRVRARLVINQVETHDIGYYKCEATNSANTVESVAVLWVRAGKNIWLSIFVNSI